MVPSLPRSPPAWNEELLISCGFLLCKGLVSPMDLVSVQLPSRRRLFSFLSLAWGFVADVDIESEKYRHMGAVRFLMGTLVRLASLRVYRGRLAFLPLEAEPEAPMTCTTRRTVTAAARAKAMPPDDPKHDCGHHRTTFCPHPASALRCRSVPSPSTPTSTSPSTSPNHNRSEGINSNRNTTHCSVPAENNQTDNQSKNQTEIWPPTQTDTQNDNHTDPPPAHGTRSGTPVMDSLLPPPDQPLPASWTVVSEEDFVLVLAMFQSHLSEDLWTAPGAAPDDGLIHLFYVTAGISRPALLRLFLAMEKGAHLDCGCPHLVYEKVRALRLEPLSPHGAIAVDGEVVEYGPLQAQVHPGLARLICG